MNIILSLLKLINPAALEISVEKFMKSLPYAGYGMLGIFIVISIIMVMMLVLNKVAAPKDDE